MTSTTTWQEIKLGGTVIYYVDVNEPGHIRVYSRLHGKVAWLEFRNGELVTKPV